MAKAAYRPVAVRDLDWIFVHTKKRWDETQAVSYLSGLEDTCGLLAGQPRLGRACGYLRAGLRRMEHESHVIFYFEVKGGIRISRVLHKGMMPKWGMF